MRAAAPFVLVTVGTLLTSLGACGSLGEPSDAPAAGHQLTLPIRYASSHELTIYHRVQPDLPIGMTELSYGLADGYPQKVRIAAKGIALSPECEARLGEVVWSKLVDVKGTAARLSLTAGWIDVELLAEGAVSATLEGEILGQECAPKDKPAVNSVKLFHRVVLQVDRVAGFVVDQPNQQLNDCQDQLVLPSRVPLRAPVAHPLNAAGRRFDPRNAPSAAPIVLRSTGAWIAADPGELMADPGMVSVSVDTQLPVQGLRSFRIAGPESLTTVPITLYLEHALSKGSMRERIQEGMTYKLRFPEQRNSVSIEVSPAMTEFGKLCANLPPTWFAATSSTPEQCAPRATGASADAETFPLNPFPIATIGSLGECRLEVTLPGSGFRWTTRFGTTR